MIFYDTETCGFHGPIVLIQYAYDDGPIELFCPWKQPISDTLELIEEFMYHEEGLVGFNLAFDHFHLCQMYTTLLLLKDKDRILEDAMDDYIIAEPQGRFGPCLKPQACLDLMLHARKGPYQSTMDRNDIRIKRVPSVIAYELAKELTERIKFKDVYFARKANKKERWKVYDIKDDLDAVIPDFKDVVLKFMPSSALKALCTDIGLVKSDTRLLFTDIELPKIFRPDEIGFAPFAKALEGKYLKAKKRYARPWPTVIQRHIDHWSYNRLAREYAEADVHDTRGLYKFFAALVAGLGENEAKDHALNGNVNDYAIQMDDDDSVLSCSVAAVRWRGFKLNIPKLTELYEERKREVAAVKINFNSIEICRRYLLQVLSPTEAIALVVNGKTTTKGVILEELSNWRLEEVHKECNGMGCKGCEDGFIPSETPHPVATRAREILDYRHNLKEIELFEKLLAAGRFHASFKVIGALSGRMSGGDGLNPQGIKRATYIRECFDLADDDYTLCGGDFAGSQVAIADAVFQDPVLHEEMTTYHVCPKCDGEGTLDDDSGISVPCYVCDGEGKSTYKIHGLFGTCLFPGMTYNEILLTKGLPNEQDKYGRSKNGVFAVLFGGNEYTLQNRVGISEQAAIDGYKQWVDKYLVWAEKRREYQDMFCSMRQPKGIGTAVEWHEPEDYIEALFGYRRYFTMENRICRALFLLAQEPPKHWKDFKIRVVRRDRQQTASGALQSALYAAAFAIQASNMRAAANHVIQAPEAAMIKNLQCRVWTIQPAGINHWRTVPMNIHDEIMSPTLQAYVPQANEIVESFIEEMKQHIPLVGMDWGNDLTSWASK